MKQVIRVDENGFYVEPVLIQDDAEIPADCVETPFIDGMYKPKWTGEEWIEGATQEEIDSIKANQPEPQPEPTLEELKDETEITALAVMELAELILGEDE